jgi:hypothetical protein
MPDKTIAQYLDDVDKFQKTADSLGGVNSTAAIAHAQCANASALVAVALSLIEISESIDNHARLLERRM